MKFRIGDRVVATNDDFLKNGVGTVTGVHVEQGAYGVLFDKEEHRGPLGSGSLFMYENEIEKEELQ